MLKNDCTYTVCLLECELYSDYIFQCVKLMFKDLHLNESTTENFFFKYFDIRLK